MKSRDGYRMVHIFVALLFAAIFFGSWGIVLSRAAYDEETVYVDAYNPPFMYGKNDEATGIYSALVRAVFSKLGEEVAVRAVPWKRALAYLDMGKGGVGGIYKTKSRLDKYDYTDEIFSEEIMVYVPKGKAFAFSSVYDLAGKRLGVIRAWSYGGEFDEAREKSLFKIEERHDDISNFNKLVVGHLDALLAIKESAELIIAKNNLSDKVECLITPLATNSTYIAYSKKSDKRALIQRINRTINAMRRDGSYDKVLHDIINVEIVKAY